MWPQCDNCHDMWQLWPQCDNCEHMWQLWPHWKISNICDNCHRMWQLWSHDTILATCDNSDQVWELSSNVTWIITCGHLSLLRNLRSSESFGGTRSDIKPIMSRETRWLYTIMMLYTWPLRQNGPYLNSKGFCYHFKFCYFLLPLLISLLRR